MTINRLLKILLVVLFLGATGLALVYREQFTAEALSQWVNGAGLAGPLLFMLIYAIGTVLFLPGSILTLAGGAIFGPVWGTLYNLTGATLGALLSFLVARYIAAEWVEQKSAGRLKQLKSGVEAEGWRFVAFVRLVPLFPFNLLNYALGLTRIRLSDYFLATTICMLPGAIAYTYLGYAGREALGGGADLLQKGLIALALLAATAFLPSLIARLRAGPTLTIEQLKERLDGGTELLLLDVRTADAFVGEQSHLLAAVNLPLEELPARLDELQEHLERPVALICTTDRRSAKAAGILAKAGFSDVHVVIGGMTAWHKQGWPVC